MAAEWDALQTLFEGALARPKEERAAFLDEHANGDAPLRREVESLLAAHESAGEFLSAPALGARPEPPDGPGSAGPPAHGSARLATGTSLGVFSILEPIGAGGMGEVYRARDTALHREVAIKVLPDLFAQDPDRLVRSSRPASRRPAAP